MISASSPVQSVAYDDEHHAYAVNGEPVPSVTQVIAAASPKPALTWWGMRVGIAAVVSLMQEGAISWPALSQLERPSAIYDKRDPAHDEAKAAIERLVVKARLSTNHIRDDAAERGSLIHEGAQLLAAGGVPDLDEHPAALRGYLQALCAWWSELEPVIELSEVIVGSATHRYAGRFDALLRYDDDDTPTLVDFKTSAGIYDEVAVQLAAYRDAFAQCSGRSIGQAQAIHLRHDGSYAVHTYGEEALALASAEFLAARQLYDARAARADAAPKPKKRRTPAA